MTERNPAIFLQSGSHPAEDVRRWISATAHSEGIVGYGDLKVTEKSGTPNMSVDVAGGRAYIAGDEGTYQGTYFVENRASTNVVIPAANGTNPRKDLIVARVRDSAYSGATNAWALEVVQGTAAASPAEPAVPNNAIVLALVDVPANDTAITNSQITDRRSYGGRPWTQPWGVIDTNTHTSNVSLPAGTTVDLGASAGLTTTWTALANRTYHCIAKLHAYGTSAELVTGSLFLDGSQVTADILSHPATGLQMPITLSYTFTTTAASHTIKVQALASLNGVSGGAGGTLYATSTVPAQMILEDIGPASVG